MADGAGLSNRAVNKAMKDADTLLPATRLAGGLLSLTRPGKGNPGFARAHFISVNGKMRCVPCTAEK